MVIANPIYDVVFKRVLENEQVAKFFISSMYVVRKIAPIVVEILFV